MYHLPIKITLCHTLAGWVILINNYIQVKAASQQERVKLWEQHFKNLIGNPPKITDEPITRIISKQLDVKLGPFTKEKLSSQKN